MADIVKPNASIHPKATYVLGLDVARAGKDDTAFVILEKPFVGENIFITYIETTNKTKLTDTIGRALFLHSLYNFKKIYVDATGLGSGVYDVLKSKIGQGVVEEVIFTRASKAEMFYNLKLLMQQNKFKIPNYITSTNPLVKKMYYQFLSIQYEHDDDSRVPKIFHEDNAHDDIICATALAALYFNQRRLNKRGYFLAGMQNN